MQYPDSVVQLGCREFHEAKSLDGWRIGIGASIEQIVQGVVSIYRELSCEAMGSQLHANSRHDRRDAGSSLFLLAVVDRTVHQSDLAEDDDAGLASVNLEVAQMLRRHWVDETARSWGLVIDAIEQLLVCVSVVEHSAPGTVANWDDSEKCL